MPETKRPGAVGAAPGPRERDLADRVPDTSPTPTAQPLTQSWRDVLPIHPAADLFPLMSKDELKALGEDIKKNGLANRIVFWTPKRRDEKFGYSDFVVLDGRNRLDAMELAGIELFEPDGSLRNHWWSVLFRDLLVDPYAYVISANIHRRHLTAEQRRDLIAKLIKATPEKSDRQIAETVKASPTTVGSVRAGLEATGDVSKLDTRTDSQGREQPARKTRFEQHYCRQCCVRSPVGEIQQYNTSDPYYEGDDIWLHNACVAAWEAAEQAARATAPKDDLDVTRDCVGDVRDSIERAFAVLGPKERTELCASLRRLLLEFEWKASPPPADEFPGIPPFLRRAAP